MVYEVIGKIVLYIIGTSLFGAFFGSIVDDYEAIFWGMDCEYCCLFETDNHNHIRKDGENG